jgi:hypothetical protein
MEGSNVSSIELGFPLILQETEEDMRRSIFCVCPPGNTQDSARVWRSIIFGCIPVTFFRWVPGSR